MNVINISEHSEKQKNKITEKKYKFIKKTSEKLIKNSIDNHVSEAVNNFDLLINKFDSMAVNMGENKVTGHESFVRFKEFIILEIIENHLNFVFKYLDIPQSLQYKFNFSENIERTIGKTINSFMNNKD